MQFQNEHLLPGQLGHLCVVLSFVAALFAAYSYFQATQRRDFPESDGWRKLGRIGFGIHWAATLGVIGCLFFLLVSKYYEYQYAFNNISDDLPFRYTFSAFWKEQQGSFLLWSFWHCLLGGVLILRAKKWEAPVLTVIAVAEAVIASMILGIYFGDWRMGASPFDLLRETMDAPIFHQADYLIKIKGNGLNPLLQNYWMTIHPPTLFLGFASTIVPFGFAVAGLWTREHKAWLNVALPWALFSGAILGTGILMGGMWAYEALSFGGYWAWDPVENTSLVPWLALVAGLHAHLVARATGHSLRAMYLFYLTAFILVLYSTYLTRSGILGDTSAHAFTEMGLGFQLILFIVGFLGLSTWLLASRWRGVPVLEKEESATSREFWMFIGALVLFFSAVLITGATSLPVWNKIVQAFKPEYAGAVIKDPIEHHNRYQLWIAVFIGLLTGVAQWLRFGERNWAAVSRKFLTHILVAAAVAGVLTWLNSLWLKIWAWQFYAMLFAAMFGVVANLDFLISFLKGNLKQGASALSHIGFGLLCLGILGTGLNKEYISTNRFAMEGLIEGMDKNSEGRNLLLLRDAPMPMKDGWEATYVADTLERQTRTFTVNFRQMDSTGKYMGNAFTLHPNVMYDRGFSKVTAANPSTEHFWNKDIFTHVTSLPKAELDRDFAKQQEDSLKFEPYEGRIGDTIFTRKHYLIVKGLTAEPKSPQYKSEPGDIAVGLNLEAHALDDPKAYPATPFILMRPGAGVFNVDANLNLLTTRIRLPEKAAPQILAVENYTLKDGQAAQFNGNTLTFKGFEKQITNPNYHKQEGDIAVQGKITVTDAAGKAHAASPVFCIRGNQTVPQPDFLKEIGLTISVVSINPQDETVVLSVAQLKNSPGAIPIEVAENASRSDYIVLEAIVFPGINLVWAGSILMLFGLGLSWVRRRFFAG